MAIGGPDYFGVTHKIETVNRPSLIFPSGKVYFFDDLEATTLKWLQSGIGTVLRSTTKAFAGNASLELATTDTLPISVIAQKFIAPLPSKIIGIEIKFNFDDTDVGQFAVRLGSDNATSGVIAEISYAFSNLFWSLKDENGDSQKIEGSDMTLARSSDIFYYFKMIIDFNKNEYVAFFINDFEISLAGKALDPIITLNSAHHLLRFELVSTATNTSKAYIDDIVFTNEE